MQKENNCQCLRCNKEFYVKPYIKKRGGGKFCSVDCFSLELHGILPAQYPIVKKCLHCGVEMIIKSSGERKRMYCSNSCRASNSNKRRLGVKYNKQTNDSRTFRSMLLAFYEHRCMICGYEKFVDAHHIVPKSKGGKSEIENGLLVCPNCHREIHHNLISGEDILYLRDKAIKK